MKKAKDNIKVLLYVFLENNICDFCVDGVKYEWMIKTHKTNGFQPELISELFYMSYIYAYVVN